MCACLLHLKSQQFRPEAEQSDACAEGAKLLGRRLAVVQEFSYPFGFRHDTANREMKSQIGLSYFVHARPILMSHVSSQACYIYEAIRS
jgi:hypothetical protein